jgi:hypothetical protein
MGGLHGGHHAKVDGALKITGTHDLRVLDAVPEVLAARVALESLFVSVQDHGVGASPNGVDAHLPTPGRGLIDDRGEVLGAGEQQAPIAFVVAVVLEQAAPRLPKAPSEYSFTACTSTRSSGSSWGVPRASSVSSPATMT